MTALIIIIGYLVLLLALGVLSSKAFRGTSEDYFVASHSIGPFLLLMSIFGTTMTAFALIGSTGEAFEKGIGTYGKMASWSGLIHSAVFFMVGIKIWGLGKRYGYLTQVQYFRDRFQSNVLGMLLFPCLVGLVIPYLLIGLLGAGAVVRSVTTGTFPGVFAATGGGIPGWLTNAVICAVVLTYVFFGGLRGAVWANTFQTLVFMAMGVVAFYLIAKGLGGMEAASRQADPARLIRGEEIPQLQFFTYCFVPLSVGMFPHLFQHWLTARSAKTFRLAVIAHPIFIMIVWVPCILIGVWATGALMPDGSPVIPAGARPNVVLGIMVQKLTDPLVAGFLTAGILAAIMSSLDSQFICLGTMFTNDVVIHHFGRERFSERQIINLARLFIVLIVLITYLFSIAEPRRVFTLGVWCFSGFGALFPLILASLYWRRTTRAGAIACVAATALVWFILFRASGYGADRNFLVWGMMPVAVITMASVLSLVGVSLITRPPAQHVLDKFFPQPSKEPLSR